MKLRNQAPIYIGVALLLCAIVPYATTAATTNVIRDNLGHTWSPTGPNLQKAFSSLQTNGELWIPAGTYSISSSGLAVTKSGVKVHGAGNSTVLAFTGGGRLYTGSTTRYSLGVNNLLLENFKVTGSGNIEITVGDNTILRGITATNIAKSPGAIRFVLPTKDHTSNNLQVLNCHTSQTASFGFQINGIAPGWSNTLSNVLFDHCTASWAGFVNGRPSGNTWSAGFDMGEGYSHCQISEPSTTVRYCTTDHNWENGFHIETAVKRVMTFDHCRADYNGQKRIYQPSATKYFASGFVAEAGTKLVSCSASYNTNKGVMQRSGPVIISMTGTGNWNGLL
jgi:hypothetical protein